MTPEKQRIAIAEECGLTRESMGPDFDKIPDYPNDLNAMHEAEVSIGFHRYPDRERYYPHLSIIKEGDCMDLPIWMATAAQRAEAFLRTIGKWEEEQ